MKPNPSTELELFLKEHPELVFHNGRGSTILINYPASLSRELADIEFSIDTYDLVEIGIAVPTSKLPFKGRINAKLSQEQVDSLLADLNGGETTVSVAAKYNVSRQTVSAIKNGRSRT